MKTCLRCAAPDAPRNTPVEIIDKLNREIDAGVADSKMKARLTAEANSAVAVSVGQRAALMASQDTVLSVQAGSN